MGLRFQSSTLISSIVSNLCILAMAERHTGWLEVGHLPSQYFVLWKCL